jgi:hypothetical protein
MANDRKDKGMRYGKIVACAMLLGFLTACSSPQDDAAKALEGSHKAQEEVARERLELIDKYKTCVDGASGDAQKIEACDSYLRAAEALK